ncbi:hypothetical protein V2W30_15490 [Streptomyces sp. Q6]|uniref:Uncharacterized protein n=1 Tax=Streptomyces citrinus TaxID=3118173 RepID=A0ACD5AC13_9ACTN
MTVMAVGLLIAAALFAVLGLVNQSWLQRHWPGRRSASSGRPEPTASASGWRRVLFLILAVTLAYQGVKGLRLADETSWSADELRRTVDQAASALEREPHISDPQDDYGSLVESEVMKAGEGSGPLTALDVTSVDKDSYAVTATGAGDGFCLRISESPSDEGGLIVPGAGDQSPTHVPAYDLKTKVTSGRC